MLWIIGNTKKIESVFANDQDNLSTNASLMGNMGASEYSYNRETVGARWKGELGEEEDIFVLAHSGFDEGPWIGGMHFGEFADALISKFGAAGLADRTIWFLTCLTGDHVVDLANLLKDRGAEGTALYMPTDFMFVSTLGIPHIITGYDSLKAVNEVVGKNSSKYKPLKVLGAEPTGIGWRGATVGDDAVTEIDAYAVQEAARTRFDGNSWEL